MATEQDKPRLLKPRERQAALAALAERYGDEGTALNYTNSFELLIAVMLSAHTTDVAVNSVTGELFKTYPDAATMGAAEVSDVRRIIARVGLANTKAARLVETARLLAERHGGEVPADLEALMALPGVGRKTANVVLSNAFGVAAIPVDTHVFRVANRLGLADAKNVEKTERHLQVTIPRAQWAEAHHWLIWHGRRVCKAPTPKCESCFLTVQCHYFRRTGAWKGAKALAVAMAIGLLAIAQPAQGQQDPYYQDPLVPVPRRTPRPTPTLLPMPRPTPAPATPALTPVPTPGPTWVPTAVPIATPEPTPVPTAPPVVAPPPAPVFGSRFVLGADAPLSFTETYPLGRIDATGGVLGGGSPIAGANVAWEHQFTRNWGIAVDWRAISVTLEDDQATAVGSQTHHKRDDYAGRFGIRAVFPLLEGVELLIQPGLVMQIATVDSTTAALAADGTVGATSPGGFAGYRGSGWAGYGGGLGGGLGWRVGGPFSLVASGQWASMFAGQMAESATPPIFPLTTYGGGGELRCDLGDLQLAAGYAYRNLGHVGEAADDQLTQDWHGPSLSLAWRY